MDLLKSFLMGVIQGITEFLPISSSGHLAIAYQIIKGSEKGGLFFILLLHISTLIVVITFFWNDFLILVRGGLKFYKLISDSESKLFWLVVVATVVTVLVALVLYPLTSKIIESNYKIIGVFWLVNSTVLLLPVLFNLDQGTSKQLKDINLLDSIIIGISQGLATLPGISRSGTTISTALLIGFDRTTSGIFSFLLFIPASIGSFVYELARELNEKSLDTTFSLYHLVGSISSLIFSYLALYILIKLLKEGKIFIFSLYTFIAGILVLLL